MNEILGKFTIDIDRAVFLSMLWVLQKNNLFVNENNFVHKEDLFLKFGKYKSYNIVLRWIDILLDNDYLIKIDESIYKMKRKTIMSDDDIGYMWEKLKNIQYSSICPYEVIDYFYENVKYLDLFLHDKYNPTWILFPKGNTRYAEVLYEQIYSAKYLNEVLSSELEKMIADKRIHILELGAGIGATTSQAINILKGKEKCIEEYYYTDISRFFLNYGEKKFSECLNMKYKIINVNKMNENEYFDEYFDVVIAVGVLNNCSNIKKTLIEIRKMLKFDGILMVIETIMEFSVMLISQVFMMEKAEDLRGEHNRTFFDFEEWKCLFKETEFEILKIIPETEDILGQKLFIVRKGKG